MNFLTKDCKISGKISIVRKNVPNKFSIFLREQLYPAKVNYLSIPLGVRLEVKSFEILNGNPYFLLHIFVDDLESFLKPYNKTFFH